MKIQITMLAGAMLFNVVQARAAAPADHLWSAMAVTNTGEVNYAEGCEYPRNFAVTRDGRFKTGPCRALKRPPLKGTLTREEIRQVGELANRVEESMKGQSPHEAPRCFPYANASPTYTDMILTDRTLRLRDEHTDQQNETCYRGDEQVVDELTWYLTELSAKYYRDGL
jgi:hypothetical protein